MTTDSNKENKMDAFFKKSEGKEVTSFPSGVKAAKGKIGMAYDKLKDFAKKNGAEIAVYSSALLTSGGMTLWGAMTGASPEVVFAGAVAAGGIVAKSVDVAVSTLAAAKAKKTR